MAEQARSPDYLHLLRSEVARVRNLETGVHPLISEGQSYDTYPAVTIPRPAGASPFWSAPSLGANAAAWQRRMGLVSLSGLYVGYWQPGVTEYLVGRLPVEARPIQDTELFECPSPFSASLHAYVRAEAATGNLYVVRASDQPDQPQSGGTGNQTYLGLYQVTWAAY